MKSRAIGASGGPSREARRQCARARVSTGPRAALEATQLVILVARTVGVRFYGVKAFFFAAD